MHLQFMWQADLHGVADLALADLSYSLSVNV